MHQITVPIRGMTCGGCVRSIRDALGRLPGVSLQAVTVGSATLSYDPSLTDHGAVFAAIEGAGYMPQAA